MSTRSNNYSAEVTQGSAGLQTLASSSITGWTSDTVDNTTNLYLDSLVQFTFSMANTAPANDQCIHVFVWGASNSLDLPTTGATTGGTVGTQGSLTFPNITANAQNLIEALSVPYVGQNIKIVTNEISVASFFGGSGNLPPYWGLAVLNYSGAAFTAATVKWRGLKDTSA